MGSRSIQAHAKSDTGAEVTLHSHDTDALILPVPQLEALHRFRPDLIDVVIEETRAEAAHRRQQEARINGYVFVERMIGQVSAIILTGLGIGGAVYAGIHGATAVGVAIVTATIGTLAVTIVTRRQRSHSSEEDRGKPRK